MTNTKPLAVVTGASSGIGFELAADNGYDLLVNAEDNGLEAAAEQLRAVSGGLQRLQVFPAVVCPSVGQRAQRYRRHHHRADARPDRHRLLPPKDDPALVAKQGFEALMGGKNKIVAGSAPTKAQGVAGKLLPDKLKAAAHRQMAQPEPGE